MFNLRYLRNVFLLVLLTCLAMSTIGLLAYPLQRVSICVTSNVAYSGFRHKIHADRPENVCESDVGELE